jgi:acyl-coenzyme A synthetase/AMP-(fatty) acid ligase/acyl carrier protein
MIKEFGINDEDKYLEFATFNFDASLEQIFVPLLSGAEIFLRGNDYWIPSDFIKLIKEEGITVINPPTVYWNQFVSAIAKGENSDIGKLRLVISGGAEMKRDLLSEWNEKVGENIKLINAYGPTETIITSTMFRADEKEIPADYLHTPIGRATGSRDVFIIDSFGNLVPPSVPGELCFASDLLARGYLNNSAMTAQKFIPDNFGNVAGRRLYKTGDLARYDDNGVIEFLGRIDNQIKIRGYRIELGEIEEVLLSHPEVTQTAVIVNSQSPDNESLVAFVVLENENSEIAKDLLQICRDKLPEYMLPSNIININSIPLTANGKVDKNKLMASGDFSIDSNIEYVAPRSDLESEIAKIVGKTLGAERIGVKDNFFKLGGHSILAIKVVSEIREMFGVDLELKKLFENPTVEGLSEAVIMEQSKSIDNDELESLLEQIEKME